MIGFVEGSTQHSCVFEEQHLALVLDGLEGSFLEGFGCLAAWVLWLVRKVSDGLGACQCNTVQFKLTNRE